MNSCKRRGFVDVVGIMRPASVQVLLTPNSKEAQPEFGVRCSARLKVRIARGHNIVQAECYFADTEKVRHNAQGAFILLRV